MTLEKPLKNATCSGRRKRGWEKQRLAFSRSTAHSVCKFFSSLLPANCVFFSRCSAYSRPFIACNRRFCLSLFDPAIAGAFSGSLIPPC